MDQLQCTLDIVDTAGEDQILVMQEKYITRGEGFVCVFAIDDWGSFEDVISYVSKIRLIKDSHTVPILLVGNKLDLRKNRQVEKIIADNYASNQGIPFIETSAKTAEGVHEVFLKICRQIQLWKDSKNKSEIALNNLSCFHILWANFVS